MSINRRAFLAGGTVAAFGGAQSASANALDPAHHARVRIGRAAFESLPAGKLASLQQLGQENTARSARWLLDRVADDYRSGRTEVLAGVLLSRTELSLAIDAALKN